MLRKSNRAFRGVTWPGFTVQSRGEVDDVGFGVPALMSMPWNQLRDCSRCWVERMWLSFWRSSQTMSVGRCSRRLRPRSRWPVPKASMVTPLQRTIELLRHVAPLPAAPGYFSASSSFSTSSAFTFSKCRRPDAWCRKRSRYTARAFPMPRRYERQGAERRFAPPRGPSKLILRPRRLPGGRASGQPKVHARRRLAEMSGQERLAPGDETDDGIRVNFPALRRDRSRPRFCSSGAGLSPFRRRGWLRGVVGKNRAWQRENEFFQNTDSGFSRGFRGFFRQGGRWMGVSAGISGFFAASFYRGG